jgi:hypothetical protein
MRSARQRRTLQSTMMMPMPMPMLKTMMRLTGMLMTLGPARMTLGPALMRMLEDNVSLL